MAPSAHSETPGPGDAKPEIVWKAIPFDARRRQETAAYSDRHYGEATYALTDPQVIVEHYTDGSSFHSAWSHFAANRPHLGEKPGVCSHFLIDKDGTIYQLVDLGLRCRHAIGMNWTAIGVEHVGTSAEEVLGNDRVLRASLQLTGWLMTKFDIRIGNVIGHAEILRSPFHRELVESWRSSTHADFDGPEMDRYRSRLERVTRRPAASFGARSQATDDDG